MSCDFTTHILADRVDIVFILNSSLVRLSNDNFVSLSTLKKEIMSCFSLRPATTFLIVVFSDFVEHTVAAVARLRNTTAHTRDMETMIIGQLSRVEASRECGDEWMVIQMADVIVASVVYEMLDSPNTQLALLVAVKCKTTAKRHDKWSKFFKLCHSSLSWFYTVELTAHLRLSLSLQHDWCAFSVAARVERTVPSAAAATTL